MWHPGHPLAGCPAWDMATSQSRISHGPVCTSEPGKEVPLIGEDGREVGEEGETCEEAEEGAEEGQQGDHPHHLPQ